MVANDFYTALSDKGVIQLSGEEQIKYLQGQVTADISTLNAERALLGCHCDFKGKTWSVSYFIQWQQQILMLMHQSVLPKSLAELNKYGVFAKVEISDVSADWLVFAGAGSVIEAEIIRVFASLPEQHQQTISNENGVVLAIQGHEMRYLVLQPRSASHLLDIETNSVAQNLWEVEDIKAGIADVRQATANEFVPQMMNLQVLNAISFSKGCYMGQEVVARTKYLGKNKRAAFRLFTEQVIDASAGQQLEYQIGENWRPGGTILRSGHLAAQTWLLAVLASDTEAGTVMRLKDDPSAEFTVLPQPYEIA